MRSAAAGRYTFGGGTRRACARVEVLRAWAAPSTFRGGLTPTSPCPTLCLPVCITLAVLSFGRLLPFTCSRLPWLAVTVQTLPPRQWRLSSHHRGGGPLFVLQVVAPEAPPQHVQSRKVFSTCCELLRIHTGLPHLGTSDFPCDENADLQRASRFDRNYLHFGESRPLSVPHVEANPLIFRR